ncbi:hypothetical protein [Granulicella tundricola]|uniref:Uncharacterized protein n=1 Tax=Granulicella tundricola (strain ATCC BAA-1859 / DSM 23138 / MP5ACTX9) TaxID=1198114 RepID=E8X638_GRATM|nr:hypothetical protein [Granulicella tundricola]ADW70922.1 hypothetical protein AciX9_4142 [Granulicella tundricola MP5ACTX9]
MHISSQIASSISTGNLKSNPPAALDSIFKHALVAASQTAMPAPTSPVEKKSDHPKNSTDQAAVPAHQFGTLPVPVPVALSQPGISLPDNGSSSEDQSAQSSGPGSSSSPSLQTTAPFSATVHPLQAGVEDGVGQFSDTPVTGKPAQTPDSSSATAQPTQPVKSASEASAKEDAAAPNRLPIALPIPQAPGADLSGLLDPASPDSSQAPATDGTANQPTQPPAPSDPAALLASVAQTTFVVPAVVPTLPALSAGQSTSNAVAALGSAKPAGVAGKTHAPSSDIAARRKVDESDTDASETESAASNSATLIQAEPQVNHSAPDHQSAANDPAAQQALQAALSSSVPAHASIQAVTPTITSGADAAATQTPVTVKPEAVSTPALSSAQLIQSMHGSEMRLGMHSTEFGSISINTSLSRQVLSAQISTDHSELSRALAVHMPAIQEKLGNAYGIQAKVEVHNSSSASSGESARESNSQHNDSRRQGRTGSLTGSPISLLASSTANSSSSASVASSDARLDIRI